MHGVEALARLRVRDGELTTQLDRVGAGGRLGVRAEGDVVHTDQLGDVFEVSDEAVEVRRVLAARPVRGRERRTANDATAGRAVLDLLVRDIAG